MEGRNYLKIAGVGAMALYVLQVLCVVGVELFPLRTMQFPKNHVTICVKKGIHPIIHLVPVLGLVPMLDPGENYRIIVHRGDLRSERTYDTWYDVKDELESVGVTGVGRDASVVGGYSGQIAPRPAGGTAER